MVLYKVKTHKQIDIEGLVARIKYLLQVVDFQAFTSNQFIPCHCENITGIPQIKNIGYIE